MRKQRHRAVAYYSHQITVVFVDRKLRALSHDLRERVLVTFDDHGFIYDETVEEGECQKENTEMETFSQSQQSTSCQSKRCSKILQILPLFNKEEARVGGAHGIRP